ncbi:MAG: AbrB/MazE/SpoVT family DNA-binding domain-containing protein [Planctomycetaceae bacterium]
MLRKLSKHGDDLALVIDRPVLELLGIDEETSLSISTDGRTLIIAPVQDESRQERFRTALEATNRQFGNALKRLAE